MTATYEKRGLRFLYPENWQLRDESEDDLNAAITLEAPGGAAFWSVHLYPADADADEILNETTRTLQETYSDLETSAVITQLGKHQGPAIEAMFYCLDFLIRSRLQVIQGDAHQLLFWFQAEDRDFDQHEPVFQAMAVSLLQNL